MSEGSLSIQTSFPGYSRTLDDGTTVWVSSTDQFASGMTRLQNSVNQVEELTSQGIDVHVFPEGVFSLNGGKVDWDIDTLHSMNADTLNELDSISYIKKHTYFNGRSDLDISGLSRKYSVKRGVGMDVELPIDIDNVNTLGHPNHMKFVNGKVDLVELDIDVDEYFEMIQSGDFDIIRSQHPETIIVPSRANNGGLLSISEKQRLMEDSLDIVDGVYHINIMTDAGVSQIPLGDTVAPINRLEGILVGNYADDGINKQIYFQTPFSSTDQAIADAHELRQAEELYNNDIHRQNELHGLSGGEIKFKDESLGVSKMVLNNVASYNSNEVRAQISSLRTTIDSLDENIPSEKELIDQFEEAIIRLKSYDGDFSKILNKQMTEARRYKLATESVLDENIKVFETSLENKLHKIELPIDLNQHRMTWDNSGIGIKLPTSDTDSFTLTSGSLFDEFFLEPNTEYANLNKLLGQNNNPLDNDAVAKLIDQGKLNVIPAKQIPMKSGGNFVAGPFIIVDDRILLPNYKINPDGTKTLIDFRNERLISQGINSKGVPYSLVDTKKGNDILSNGSPDMTSRLDVALTGDANAGQTALAEQKISSIPNFLRGTVLSEQGDQAQAEVQSIISKYSLMRDLNTRQEHLSSLSYEDWSKKADDFTMEDAMPNGNGFNSRDLGYSSGVTNLAFAGRNSVDRTSIDLMNIRMIKERQDQLLKSSIMQQKIVLPELDAAGNIITKERTTLEIYQRSIVTGLENAKGDTSSFLEALSTINLWGAADNMRIADDITSNLKINIRGRGGDDISAMNLQGLYDIDGGNGRHMHTPQSLVFQDGTSIKNDGWLPLDETSVNINSLSKVEFGNGGLLSIGDAFNADFALLNRINGRPATVSQVVDSAGYSQMKFFGYDNDQFAKETRFKAWWNRFRDEWASIGKDMPPGVSKDLHDILRDRKVQNFLVYRLKIQWELLRSLAGEIDMKPSLLISGGASATIFFRLAKIVKP
ncbi:MAG: hypothetical protein GPJ54_11680 [Candidatus Heimdallarchaeota archaeon]|nr:hypothetical protein [Candidatus Heimdallarchaeota archaeon]